MVIAVGAFVDSSSHHILASVVDGTGVNVVRMGDPYVAVRLPIALAMYLGIYTFSYFSTVVSD
jgi:hypothetical protein